MYFSYSNFDYRRILGSELSRAEAESLMASDYEDDLSDDGCKNDDCQVDNVRKGDAVSFMGQLTPGSSVGKARSRTPDCQTWTRYVSLLISPYFSSKLNLNFVQFS